VKLLARLAVVVLLTVAPAISVSQRAHASPSCPQGPGIQGCNRKGRVEITGRDSSHPPSRGDRGATGPVVQPVGAHRFVTCSAGATGQLAAAGDPTAAADGAACAGEQQRCAATTQQAGRRAVATIRLQKGADGAWFLNGWVCRAVGPPAVTPAMVLQEASRLVPATPIGLAPRTRTLVNIETVMWLDARPQTQLAPVAILGQRVVITLGLDRVDWTFGDGRSDAGTTPGTPYDARNDPCTTKQCGDYYGHTYTTTGTVIVTALASWRVTFRVGSGPVARIPGTVTGPASQATVEVVEARSVLVPNPTSS
jgi:hypothetical protein